MPDRIGAERAERANLRRRLVARARARRCRRRAESAGQSRGARVVGDRAQPRRVDVGHVGKAQAEAIVVRADQRVVAHQVDVIVDHHQRAARAVRADAAGGVGQDHARHAEPAERAHREGHRLQVVAFVDVDAARQREHLLARRPCRTTSLPAWPITRRRRPVRNVAVRNRERRRRGDPRSRRGPSRARWRRRRRRTSVSAQPLGRFGRLIECTHNKKPTMMAVTKLASVPASIARSRAAPGRRAASAPARRCRRSACRSTRSWRSRTARRSRW